MPAALSAMNRMFQDAPTGRMVMSAGILVCSSDDDIDHEASNQFNVLEVYTGLSPESKRSYSIDLTVQ